MSETLTMTDYSKEARELAHNAYVVAYGTDPVDNYHDNTFMEHVAGKAQAALEKAAGDKWLPIESAPKDESVKPLPCEHNNVNGDFCGANVTLCSDCGKVV